MKEQDLYLPIKTLFESMGYEVKGEVKTVDVVAKCDKTIVAIELKKDFTIPLIAQGALRQKLTDFVYVAIPKPSAKVQKSKLFKDKIYILKRLGIGLILVDLESKKQRAKILQEPILTDIKAQQQRNKKKRAALLRELRERHNNFNIGGTRGKTITAYRESILRILSHFDDGNPHTTKEIITSTGDKRATRQLYEDHYGWFTKEGRGTYSISDKGKAALNEYDHVIKLMRQNDDV